MTRPPNRVAMSDDVSRYQPLKPLEYLVLLVLARGSLHGYGVVKAIREETDGGKPTVVAQPDSRISEIYREIARKTAAKLSLKAKDYSAKFPNIVIQNN